MDNLINNICLHFGVDKKSIAKRKFGKLPEYTYEDILTRILSNSNLSTEEVFTEMTRPTITSMLKKAFPGKIARGQNWYNYLLISIGLKRCTSCNSLLPTNSFSDSTTKFGGLRNECKECDNFRNKIHREEYCLHYKETKHNHYLEHKAEYVSRKLKRRRYVQLTTPSWANLTEIATIYKNCPEGYHVDHIIPLRGDSVCGLHVEHNMQYLSAFDNLSKGNSFNSAEYIHSSEYTPPYL